MCNCIEKIEKKFTEKMVELNPCCEVIESVSFVNLSYILDSGNILLHKGTPKNSVILRKWL